MRVFLAQEFLRDSQGLSNLRSTGCRNERLPSSLRVPLYSEAVRTGGREGQCEVEEPVVKCRSQSQSRCVSSQEAPARFLIKSKTLFSVTTSSVTLVCRCLGPCASFLNSHWYFRKRTLPIPEPRLLPQSVDRMWVWEVGSRSWTPASLSQPGWPWQLPRGDHGRLRGVWGLRQAPRVKQQV